MEHGLAVEVLPQDDFPVTQIGERELVEEHAARRLAEAQVDEAVALGARGTDIHSHFLPFAADGAVPIAVPRHRTVEQSGAHRGAVEENVGHAVLHLHFGPFQRVCPMVENE